MDVFYGFLLFLFGFGGLLFCDVRIDSLVCLTLFKGVRIFKSYLGCLWICLMTLVVGFFYRAFLFCVYSVFLELSRSFSGFSKVFALAF